MTRNRSYYYPSPWMKPDDLPPDGADFTIVGVDDEIVGRDETLTPAVGFEETDKKLLLNPTQYGAVVRLTGYDDVDQWSGVRIKCVPVTVTIKNKKAGTEEDVRTIRILPASPLVAGDQPEKSKTKSTLTRKSTPATVPDNGRESPFAA